ncbi:MAG: intradiol ring-cleavage dioxygenase [Nocardioides sp.]
MTELEDNHRATRRTVLRTGAVAGAGLFALTAVRDLAQQAVAAVPSASSSLALASSTGCATLTPELTQGPFWVDEQLNRSDIRADSTTGAIQGGVPLTLTINLQDAGGECTPQAGAYVDIWHANAQGEYSDVSGSGNPDNRGVDWLRGYQVSDANGAVTFTTIMPGWYVSRTIHIHFRIRVALSDSSSVNFTSQLFFDDTVNDTVQDTSGYQGSSGRDTHNSDDSLYDASLLVPLTGSTTAGYTGSFTASLDFGDGTSSSASSSTTTSSTTTDSTADTTTGRVAARATSVRIATRRSGRRVAIVKVRTHERVAARLRLIRGDNVRAHRRWGWLASGTVHTLRLRIPASVAAGSARLEVKLADASGNVKYRSVTVDVP